MSNSKPLLCVLAVLLSVILFAVAAVTFLEIRSPAPARASELMVGMTTNEVLSVLGEPPSLTSIGEGRVVWMYSTRLSDGEFYTVFETNDLLKAWGVTD